MPTSLIGLLYATPVCVVVKSSAASSEAKVKADKQPKQGEPLPPKPPKPLKRRPPVKLVFCSSWRS